MRFMSPKRPAGAAIAALVLVSIPVFAQPVAPNLNSAAPFAVLGTNGSPTIGTVTCTDTGPGIGITGQVGTTFAGGITNTGPCAISGPIIAPVGNAVVSDFNTAFASVDSMNPTCDGPIPTTSTSLPPGVYCSAAGTTLGAGVTLTLNGSASDVWIFKVGTGGLGALTLTNAQVVMSGSADACNVYWKTAEAATVTDSDFVGTVLSGAAATMVRGSWIGRALATTDVTLTDPAPMTFAGCAAPASITVNKDFIPNNPAAVPVALTCSSGTVINASLTSAEGAPAVFTVAGADLTGTTCTATETVPAGYAADQSGCVGVPLGGSCTIINTLNGAITYTITVNKDFIPNNSATVPVALTCSSGTVATTPLNAAEGAPAVFTVTGPNAGATCTATETVPAGYTADQTDCVDVALDGSCTITNTLISGDVVAIPTLSEWGMILLAGLLALFGFVVVRKRARI